MQQSDPKVPHTVWQVLHTQCKKSKGVCKCTASSFAVHTIMMSSKCQCRKMWFHNWKAYSTYGTWNEVKLDSPCYICEHVQWNLEHVRRHSK